MKKNLVIVLLSAIFLLIISPFPFAQAQEGDVVFVIYTDETIINDGENVRIYLDITNNKSSSIILTEFTIDGEYIYFGENLPAGETKSLYYYKDINFGQNNEYGFSALLTYSFYNDIHSNQIEFIKDEGEVDTSCDFQIIPDNTSVNKGDTVNYTINITNRGNKTFSNFNIILHGNIIETFDLSSNMSKNITYSKVYTQDTVESFWYDFTYYHNGSNHTITLWNPLHFDIDIKNETAQPTPAPTTVDSTKEASTTTLKPSEANNENMEITAFSDSSVLQSGQYANITLTVKNNSTKDMFDVGVKDDKGEVYGSWAIIEAGKTEQMTVVVYPQKSQSYTFTVIAIDPDEVQYSFSSTPIAISVSDETPKNLDERELLMAQEKEDEQNKENDSLKEKELNAQASANKENITFSISQNTLILIFMGAIVVLIIIVAVKRKK